MHSAHEQELREINEALLVSSVQQHELTELAQKAELRYRRLFESAKDGILILDHTGRITDANPFMSELLGYTQDYFRGKQLWEIGLFRDKSESDAALQEIFVKGDLHYGSVPLGTKSGALIEVEVLATYDLQNDLNDAIQCNFRDITERRRMELALTKALAYADDIIATLREPFLVLDSELRVKTANRSFYDTFHVAKEETENCHVYDLGSSQWDIPALRNLLSEVLSHRQSIHDYQVDHFFPTLGRKTMLLNARPFPPDSEHPELILLSLQDISPLRERADELLDLHRRKDEFLAMLSHELRNPLAPIVNAVELLRLPAADDSIQQQAQLIIERQFGQLSNLVDELLEISRISTGRVHLQNEQLDLRTVVERAVETTRPLIGQRGHELVQALPAAPVWLHADASRLEQVVINLLSNAAKYTEKGGSIWLNLQQQSGAAVLSIRDTGVGIAADLLPRVFDLFTQADRSLDRSQGGLGIGLALVHQLVELHGGHVEAHSVVGQGSEFIVTLPLIPSPIHPSAPEAKKAVAVTTGLRVLVVDDNVDAAQSLSMLLKLSGHEIRMAHNGLAALQEADTFQPNVVLLDIGLPHMDGFEVARQMRRRPLHKSIALVAMTGYGQESDRQRSQEVGIDYHLVKPTDFREVQGILAVVSENMS